MADRVLYCDGCGRPATVILRHDKDGKPLQGVCYTCSDLFDGDRPIYR